MLILDRALVVGCSCAMSWCKLDLTFDFAIVTLTFEIYILKISSYILEAVICMKRVLGRDICWGW